MSEQEKLQRGKRRTKIILITVTVLFIVLMLVVPLISVITSALKEGFKFYLQSITTEYVISALGVTLIATVIAVMVNTFFGICAGMAADEVLLQRQAGAGDTDRHSVFHITCHRRSCLPHDIWKTRMDVSGDQMDQ